MEGMLSSMKVKATVMGVLVVRDEEETALRQRHFESETRNELGSAVSVELRVL